VTSTSIPVEIKCTCGSKDFEPKNPLPTDTVTCVKCGAQARCSDLGQKAAHQVLGMFEKGLRDAFKGIKIK
jgi:hypothetical protein